MREKVLLTVVLLMALSMVGCGIMKQTIRPSATPNISCVPTDNPIEIGGIKKVAIFPFADYSYQQSFIESLVWGGNRVIVEEITDNLVSRGITVALQEDVNGLLGSEGIIKMARIVKAGPAAGSLEFELTKPHEKAMIKTIKEMIEAESKARPQNEPILQGVTVGLSKEKIIELGEELGVDAVIRGRILEYGVKKIKPLQGIISLMLVGGLADTVGYVEFDSYEYGLPFGVIEATAGGLRTIFPTSKESSVIQVRMYFQDAKTGELLWSNRVEIEYSPICFERDYKMIFDRAVKKGVGLLMADLFAPEEEGNRDYIYKGI